MLAANREPKAPLRALLILIFGACVACCTDPFSTTNVISKPLSARPSNYAAIISENVHLGQEANRELHLRNDSFPKETFIFGRNQHITHITISNTIRSVFTDQFGWAWQACMHAIIGGVDATMAIFIKDNKIIDARSAVKADQCEAMKYVPLEMPQESRSPNPLKN